MQIYRIINKILMKVKFRVLPSRKATSPNLITFTTEMADYSFENKNITITGEFFPSNENALKEKLLKRKANVQPHLTRETQILVCGKYPDWMLIEQAKRNGVKIIVVDKASDLFTRFATNIHYSKPAVPHKMPLGI